MKKKNLPIVIGIILFSGFSLYLYQAGFGDKFFKSKTSQGPVVKSRSASEHQDHTGAGVQPQAQAEDFNEQAEDEAPTVEIPTDKQQMIGVKTVEVKIQPLQKIIRTVGRIEYDERRLATVNTKFEGWIEKLHIDYTGKYVKKGEPLAEIYSPELIATQQELINLLKWKQSAISNQQSAIGGMLAKDAETIVEAAKQRLRLWDISENQIRKIEETGKPIRTLTIYSPVNGYVVQKMALQGMRVMPGEKLFDIADLSSVWLIADIYEYELPFVKEGQRAAISLSYFPGKEIASRIEYVYPALSGDTRTVKIRFTIPNPGGRLKPQMFANVEVKVDLGKKLAIPEEAVIDTGIRQVVYVDKGDGYFEPRQVMLGMKTEGLWEVIQGLKAGERAASSATFLIDAEAKLKGVTPLEGHKH